MGKVLRSVFRNNLAAGLVTDPIAVTVGFGNRVTWIRSLHISPAEIDISTECQNTFTVTWIKNRHISPAEIYTCIFMECQNTVTWIKTYIFR